jgi:hypothetical protein
MHFVKSRRSKRCVATWSPLWNPMTEAMEELIVVEGGWSSGRTKVVGW